MLVKNNEGHKYIVLFLQLRISLAKASFPSNFSVESFYVVKDICNRTRSFKEYFSAFYSPGVKATKLNRTCLLHSWSQQYERSRQTWQKVLIIKCDEEVP